MGEQPLDGGSEFREVVLDGGGDYRVLVSKYRCARCCEVGVVDRAIVPVLTRDASAPVDLVLSVHTDDVEAAYQEAQELGYEIVHPLTVEAWGSTASSYGRPTGPC